MFYFWRGATAALVPGFLCQSGRRRPENVSILSSLLLRLPGTPIFWNSFSTLQITLSFLFTWNWNDKCAHTLDPVVPSSHTRLQTKTDKICNCFQTETAQKQALRLKLVGMHSSLRCKEDSQTNCNSNYWSIHSFLCLLAYLIYSN